MFNFNYKYLTEKHLKGFENYKYSAVDTSPLSNYVMHPLWNLSVKVIPSWIAPNLITFVGFLFLLTDVLVLTVLDYHNDAEGTSKGEKAMSLAGDSGIPNWVYMMCGIFLFINYNLDGIDGKQARKIGVSGPIGELFDHGLDSYVVFFVPYCLIAIFGRGEYSAPPIRIYLAIVSITLNYYVSHCEKYNTGTLYLPWGYDFSMWVSSLVCIVAGAYGPAVYKIYVLDGMTFMQVLEIAIHVTGLLSTLPIAVYNVYLSYKHRTGKMYPLSEAVRPIYAMALMVSAMTTWALITPNNIVDHQLRPFLLLLGTMFSNISCRLIVAQMSSQRCDVINWMTWPLIAGVALSSYYPSLEVAILYLLLLGFLYAHIHYGVCVVRQMCGHFKVKCFSVPKIKKK